MFYLKNLEENFSTVEELKPKDESDILRCIIGIKKFCIDDIASMIDDLYYDTNNQGRTISSSFFNTLKLMKRKERRIL